MPKPRQEPRAKKIYTRTMSEELDYLRRHLKRNEAQILALALRRGVFETFKAVVLRQYAAGEIPARRASELLGTKIFKHVSSWLSPQGQ
jgi:hypothetical protein